MIRDLLSQVFGLDYWRSLFSKKYVKLLLLGLGGSVMLYASRWVYWKYIFKNIVPPLEYKLHLLNQKIVKTYRVAKQKSLVCLEIEKQEILRDEKRGLIFRINILRNLDKKPFGGATSNPFLPPFEAGLFIDDLNSTHRLLFNKFPILQYHLLVVTKEFQKQESALTPKDFESAAYAIKAVEGFGFFNSGKKAGASQPHKHIQILPKRAIEQCFIVEDMFREQYQEKNRYRHFPFVHTLRRFKQLSENESIEEWGKRLHHEYEEGMKEVKNEDLSKFYNLIFTESYLVIILRQKETAFDCLDLNAMGFSGSIILKSQAQFEKIKGKSPIDLMIDTTFPLPQQQL